MGKSKFKDKNLALQYTIRRLRINKRDRRNVRRDPKHFRELKLDAIPNEDV